MRSKHSSERLEHKCLDGDNDILAVVFSQVRVPSGKFGLERLFAGTQHQCLLLNDTENGWYIGLDLDIDTLVDQAIQTRSPRQIIYYGSSMGGYGALRTGLRRQDGAIHAFGPELRPGRPGYQSTEYGIAPDAHDLTGFGGQMPRHPVHLYFGCFDPVDAAGAVEGARSFPGAALHLLKSSHANHDHLYSVNLIRKIIRTFERDPGTELGARGLLDTTPLPELCRFAALGEDHSAGRSFPAESLAALTSYRQNPGMMRLAAESEAAQGNLEAALEILLDAERLVCKDKDLRTLPKRWRKSLPLLRVTWLMQAGRKDEARQLLRETFATYPVDETMDTMARELGMIVKND